MFFANARKYVVLGASTSSAKVGNRVLKWYINRRLPVFPINPKSSIVESLGAYNSLNELLSQEEAKDAGFGVSVIVPSKTALDSFKEVVTSGNSNKVKSVWFQPGAYDDEIINYLNTHFELDELIADGECILVTGLRRLREL